jgi:hypothetical protein
MKTILGISLAFVMLLGSVPLGFSEPINQQLEQGIEIDQIQCNNPNHLLVLRTNGNMACVSEKTALKTGWEIIKTDFKVLDKNPTELFNVNVVTEEITLEQSNKSELLTLSDENNNLLIVNTKTHNSDNLGYLPPDPLSSYPANLVLPTTVELNQSFEAKYTWQFFEVVEIDEDDPTKMDIDKASDDPHFRNTEKVTMFVNLPVKVEFVNYLDLGYIIFGERVGSGTGHTLAYLKIYDYNETEIQEETLILKVTSMPSKINNDGMGMGLNTNMYKSSVFFDGDGENTISITTERPVFEETLNELGYPIREICDDRCRDFINGQEQNKYQNKIIQKFVDNNGIISEYKPLKNNFKNYLYHNENATFKDFLQSGTYNTLAQTTFSTNSNTISDEIDLIIVDIEKEELKRQNEKDGHKFPEDVEAIAEMLNSMIDNGISLEVMHTEIIPTYGFSDSFLEELFETHTDLAPQSTELNTQSFFPSLNWILPSAFGADSTVTVYGNVYDDDANQYLSGIKVCVADLKSTGNEPFEILLRDNGDDACTYTSGSIGSFSFDDILSDDPDNDGTSADYLGVVYFENDKKVKIINWNDGEDATMYDTTNVKTNGGFSGVIGLSVMDVTDDDEHFYPIYNTINDSYDIFYLSGLQKIHLYFSVNTDCDFPAYGQYADRTSYYGACDGTSTITYTAGQSRIYMDNDMYDADFIISHEYGHFLHDEIGESKSGSLGDSQDVNLQAGLTRWEDSDASASILNEGFAEYFSLVYLNSGTVNHDSVHDPSLMPWKSIDYENRDYEELNGTFVTFPATTSFTSRADVTSALWDMSDGTGEQDSSDSDKKDDLSYGYSDVIDVIDTFDSIYEYQTKWETSNNSLSYVFYLNDVDNTFQGSSSGSEYAGNLVFEADFTSDSSLLADWVLSGDEDWETDYVAVDNVNTRIVTSDNCDNYCIMTLDGYLDLEDYTELYLNFLYRIDDYATGDEGLKVEVSTNNGNSWDEVLNYNATNGDDTNTWEEVKDYDISEYAGYAFKVKFTAKSDSSLDDIDLANFQIRGIEDSSGGGSSDSDSDGINDDIDTDTTSSSNAFDDGTTSGEITDRGGQTFSISDDSTDGVIITTTQTATSNAVAYIDLCSDKATLGMNDGDSVIATCGSVILEGTNSDTSSLGAELFSDNGKTFTARLFDGYKLTFDNVEPSISNNSTNNSINIIHNGITITLSAANTITVPSKPNLTVTQDGTSANLSWSVSDNGGTSITGYTVDYKKSSVTSWTSISSDTTSTSMDDLDLVSYDFKVLAENFMGSSDYSETKSLTLTDNSPPTLSISNNIIQEATATLTPVSITNATATDEIDANPVISNNATDNITNGFPLGETIILWIATDSSGNSANGTQTITIVDETDPKINAPDDIVKEATGNLTDVTLDEATVDEIFFESLNNNSTTSYPLGKTIVTFTATDSSENIGTNSTLITIIDTTSPEISLNGDSTINLMVGGTYVEYGATATDNYDENLVVDINNENLDMDSVGEYTITYDVTDTSGNQATQKERTVIVQSESEVTVPSKPRNLEVEPSNGQVELSWKAPLDNGNSNSSIKYKIGYKIEGEKRTSINDILNTNATITGLENNEKYEFKVYAKNDAGLSKFAKIITIPNADGITEFKRSTAPQNVSVTVGDGEVTLEWTAPSNTGGSDITGYVIKYDNHNPSEQPTWKIIEIDEETTTYTIPNLENDQQYRFKIQAVTIFSTGVHSHQVLATPLDEN